MTVATMANRKTATTNGMLDAILDRGVFVKVVCHVPTFRTVLECTDLGLAEWPPQVDAGKIKLVGERVLKNFQRISRSAYRTAELEGTALLLPYLDAAYIPIKAIPKFLDRLDEVKRQFEAERVDLYKSLDVICEQVKDNPKFAGYADLQQKIIEKIHELSRQWKFAIDYSFIEAQLPRGLSSKVRDERKLRKQAAAEQEAWSELEGEQRERVRKIMEESRQRLESELEGLVTESVTTLRARVVEVSQAVRRALERGETVRSDSYERLSSVLSSFDALNIADDSEVAERIAALRKSMEGRDKEKISEATAKQEFIAAATELAKVASKTNADEILEGFKRKLTIE